MKLFAWTPVAVLLAGLVACGKTTSPAPPSRDWAKHPAVFTMTGAASIDALGDLHGDLGAAARVLSAAGLISASTPFHWTAGSRVLVVTGDVIDKGPNALPIIDLLMTIEREAEAAGGRVVVTLGNHEAEFLADPTDVKSADFQVELQSRGLDPKKVAAGESPYGAWLLARPLAALIDGWFFSHGGNTGGLSADTLGRTFQQVADGTRESGGGRSRYDDPFLIGDTSILEQQVWWKTAATTPPTLLDANLAALPARHLVIGHDPGEIEFADDAQGTRAPGEMAERYGGRLFLIDVGMSAAVGYSQGALLRIEPGAPGAATVILPDGTARSLWPIRAP